MSFYIFESKGNAFFVKMNILHENIEIYGCYRLLNLLDILSNCIFPLRESRICVRCET